MVECGGLENRYPRKGIIGSNPILSVLLLQNNGIVSAQGKFTATTAAMFFFFCVMVLFPPFLRAEIIQLKNGNSIETKILKEDERSVTLQVPNGKIRIPKKEIRMIWRGSMADLLAFQEKQNAFAKGMTSYKAHQFEEAAEAFERALGPSTVNPIIYANIGSSYASLGDAKKAEEAFLRALEGKPDNPDILLNLGHLYETIKDYKAAATHYKKAVALKPEDMNARRSLAYCLYMSGDYPAAGKVFESLIERNDPVAACNAAAAYIQAGKLDQALAILADQLEKPSPVPRSYFLMGEVFRLQKDYSGAKSYYDQALKKDRDVLKVRTGLGWLYLDMKEPEKAEAIFNEVLMSTPDSPAALEGLAEVFKAQKEFSKAIAQYQRILEKKPDDPEVLRRLGIIYLEINQPQDALDMFRKILMRDHQDAKAHTNAGLAYALMNDADNALMEWNHALELDPNLEPALRNKALLEGAIRENRHEKAVSR